MSETETYEIIDIDSDHVIDMTDSEKTFSKPSVGNHSPLPKKKYNSYRSVFLKLMKFIKLNFGVI